MIPLIVLKRAAKHISIETNFRLKIASLIPNVEKCIYLDSDLILTENISKLWMQDIDDYYFAAVTDKKVGFNAGVLLINLKKWREDNLEKKNIIYSLTCRNVDVRFFRVRVCR